MKSKWQVVKYGTKEYAKCGGYTFKCCRKGLQLDSWIWVKEIGRYVDYKCVGRR